MLQAARADLSVDRWHSQPIDIDIVGVDLTAGAGDLRGQVRMLPDAAGAPVLNLPAVNAGGVPGVRYLSTTIDGNGIPTSHLRLQIFPPPGGWPAAIETGADRDLAWDLVIPFAGALSRALFGTWTIAAGVDRNG